MQRTNKAWVPPWGGHPDRPAVGRAGPAPTERRQGEALGTDPSLGPMGGLRATWGPRFGIWGARRQTPPPPPAPAETQAPTAPGRLHSEPRMRLLARRQPAIRAAAALSLRPLGRLPRPCPRPVLSWTLPVGTRCSGRGRQPSDTQARRSLGQSCRAGQGRAGTPPISCFTDSFWHFARRWEDLMAC